MWKSKELSDEGIKSPSTSGNSLNPRTDCFDNSRLRVKFDGNCLKQNKNKVTLTHKQVVNTYIVYETNL